MAELKSITSLDLRGLRQSSGLKKAHRLLHAGRPKEDADGCTSRKARAFLDVSHHL